MEISRGKVIAVIVLVGLIVATCKVLHGGLREVLFPQAFLRGDKWLELGYNERGFYVMGLCDGLSMSIMLGAEFHKLAWWASCTEGKTGAQLEAILRKYLEDHPERWDMLVNHLVYEMMNHYYPLVEYERTHAAEVRATKQILKDKLLEPLFEELR